MPTNLLTYLHGKFVVGDGDDEESSASDGSGSISSEDAEARSPSRVQLQEPAQENLQAQALYPRDSSSGEEFSMTAFEVGMQQRLRRLKRVMGRP